MMLADIILVAFGGGVGSLLRWLVGKLVPTQTNGIPWSTVLINVNGAFLIGYLSVLFSVEWHDRYGTALNSAVLTGLLGGYTTFSTMQLDAAKLMRHRSGGSSALYLIGSVVSGIIAAGIGAWAAGLGD